MGDIFNLMPNYAEYDNPVATDIANQIYLRVGLNANNNLSIDEPSLKKLVDAQAIPGHSFDDLVRIQTVFGDRIKTYMDDSDSLVVLNDLVNMNKYMNDNMQSEYNRTLLLREKTASGVQKVRTNFQMKKYSIGWWDFWAYMIQFTLFILMGCAILVVMFFDPNITLNKYIVIGSVTVLAIFWLFVFVLLIKQNNMRRKDDWDKFYFPSKETESSGSCKA